MAVEVNIWKSRFGKKIFVVFFFAALIPVFILSYLALNHVNHLYSTQISESLKQEAKFYGLSLYDRLLGIERELSFYASQLKELNESLKYFSVAEGYISGVYFGRGINPVLLPGNFYEPPVFSEQQIIHLQKGGTVLSLLRLSNGGFQVVMSRMLGPSLADPQIMIAVLDQEKLWGNPDLFSDQLSMCVLKNPRHYLYCTDPSGKDAIENMLSIPDTINSPETDAGKVQDKMLMGGWSLFLGARYLQPEWSIVLVQNKQNAYSILRNFSGIYVLVVILILSLISGVSVFLLRKNLAPLETLLKGIRAISNNQFNQIVTVNSSDEFREVADTVNEMSRQISSQINTLKIQAEIDQNILSRSSMDDIINVTLRGIDKILNCHFLMVGILNKEDASTLDVKGRLGGEGQALISTAIDLDPDDVELLEQRKVMLNSMGEGLVERLQDLFGGSSPFYLGIPIVDADKMYGALILGMSEKPKAEILLQLQEFGARIAVAFSNAAWEDRLYLQAHHDSLTQLPNRMLLEERLSQEISRASRAGGYLAVLFLDLDRFKNVNDSLGHEMGDALLKKVAKRLATCLRQEDIVSRLGGDEFVIVITEMKTSDEAMATSISVAEKIINQLTKPFKLKDYDVRISTCVGISMFPGDGQNVDTLLRGADSAMYHGKRQGGGVFQFYSESLNTEARYRLDMEYELYRALENDEFELYYQAKIDIRTGSINGAEALIRWNHPQKGQVSPASFIPIAEDTGQMIAIEKWVFHQATKQAASWKENCGRPISVAVNTSAKHFHHGELIEHLKSAIDSSGLNAALLEVEVTESMAMQDIEKAVSVMKDLSALGISISIDDFGTGYSSLSYLKHFPAESLKIDRGFVKNLPNDRKDVAMVRSIVTMGHNMGLKIIAEGVETIEQMNVLRAMDCDEVQGYMYSRPVSAEKFCELLNQDGWEMDMPDLYI